MSQEDEEFEFRLRMEREAAEPQEPSVMQRNATGVERAIGSVPGRFLLGVGSPAIAAMQLLGGEKGRQKAANIEEMKKRGMAANGSEGFDWAGLVGSIMPGAAIAKGVTAALPAAKTIGQKLLQGGVIGATTSAAQPVTPSPDFFTDKAKQVGIGAGAGAALPLAGGVLSSMRGAPKLNPTQAATLAEGQAAGYVVPPSSINPSFINNRLESIAGKAAVGQEAAKRNQDITNALAAKSIGLPPDTNMTEKVLKGVRDQAGKTYSDVAALSPKASWALDELKQAKHDANLYFKHYDRSADPASLQKANQAKQYTGLLEQEIENEAQQAGRTDLVRALAEARTKIAKSYDVEKALNLGDSNVSAPTLGRQLDRSGTAAKSGELATVGKMAEAFPSVMREGARVPTPGVSGTDAASSAILGTLGYGAGGPAGILAAGLPLARGPARNLVLSPAYQKFATSDPAKLQAIIDALAQQGSGVAGATAGRTQ